MLRSVHTVHWCVFVRISELTAIISISVANRGFVGPEAYTIWGAVFKKKNKNLPIQD